MGNKPVKLGLRLDQTTFEAGSVLSGRVYLSVKDVQERAKGVHLLLVGQELSVVTRQEEESGRHHRESTTTRVERSTTSLVHLDVPLTSFDGAPLEAGQYEYPFEWELPMDLPGTMRCQRGGDSHCEVSYQLTAYLYTGPNNSLWESISGSSRSDVSSSVNLCVFGKSFETLPKPLMMEPEDYPIRHCCAKKGYVQLGWDTESAVACPNSSVKVNIVGCNVSSVQVQHLKIRWMESVDWNARGHSEHVERILDESIVPISSLPEWQPVQRGSHVFASLHGGARTNGNNTYSSLYHENSLQQQQPCRLVSQMHIPSDARDTYQGRLITVRHTLVIQAVTEGHCCITSPESCALVEVQRKSVNSAAAAASSSAATMVDNWQSSVGDTTSTPSATVVEPSAPSEHHDDNDNIYVQANVLPEDWSAQTADVITLTVPSATVLGDREATPTAPMEEGTVLESAPPQDSSTTLEQMQQSLAASQNPLQVVQDHWISNPMYVTELQNATPHQYVRLLQSMHHRLSDMPQVARTMAMVMDTGFTCNHILACLWALPPYLRFEVLKEVAPLAADLDKNQHHVEQQLDANELLHFRAALR